MRRLFAALTPLILGGCVSFNMTKPTEPTRVVLPARLDVEIQGTPSITTAQARVDGVTTPVQWTYSQNSSMASGSVSVPIGMHTVTVEAEVPCWYCSGGSYRPQASVAVCVANPGALNNPGMTTISKVDKNAWIIQLGPPPSVSVAADTGTTTSHWLFEGSHFSGNGVIESVDQPCLCLKSTASPNGQSIGLAACSLGDNAQIWNAMPGGTFFYFQNNGQGLPLPCLASSGGKLVQQPCSSPPADNQLWQVRDNALGIITSPF